MINEAVISRFRARPGDLNALNGAVREIERTINDWRQTALMDLNREIAITEPSTRSIYPTVAEKSKQCLAQLRAQVAEVEREITQLTAERDRLQQRRDVATQLLAVAGTTCVSEARCPIHWNFEMDVVSRIRTRVSAIQKAMATAVAGVAEIREAIADLRNERQRIEAAPVPASEAIALLEQMLKRWEAGGRNRYIGLEPIIQAATSGQVPQIEIHQSATIGHILGLLVPMLRPQLEAALKAAVEGHCQAVPPGLPAAERQQRLAELDQELLRLETLEEEAIEAAATAGLRVDRRPDGAVEAVLGIGR